MQSIITKILKKVEQQPSEYSLGFKRISSLPKRVRKSIGAACALRGESNDMSAKQFLNGLTDAEFLNWLKVNLNK